MKILNKEQIAIRFAELRDRLNSAFTQGSGYPLTPTEELLYCICDVNRFVFEDNNTIMLAEIKQSGNQKILYINALDGLMKDVNKNQKALFEFAKHMNCSLVETSGRCGWAKILRGWKAETHYSMEVTK